MVALIWRRWLGARLALLAAVSLAVSPVCAAFAYQMRGYSLSMLLAVSAFTGMQYFLHGQQRRGWILLCLSALAQPLIMPSAGLLTFAFAGSLAVLLHQRNWRGRKIAAACGPMLQLTLLGTGTYLTFGEQLAGAVGNAANIAALRWNPWLVARHLGLALLVHLGFLLALLWQGLTSRTTPDQRDSSEKWRNSPGLVMMMVSCGCILAVLLLSLGRQVPFPRNFLLFFPVFTLGLALLLRQQLGLHNLPGWKTLLGIICFAGLSEFCCQQLMLRELSSATIRPHNLLYQYYRWMSDNRNLVSALANGEFAPEYQVLLVSNNDIHSVFWYWQRQGLPEESLYSLNEWRKSAAAQAQRRKFLFLWARSEAEAQELQEAAGRNSPWRVVREFPRRTLYGNAPP